jgi:hypothetical protein
MTTQTTHEANLERAGNLIADAAEGTLSGLAGQIAVVEITGMLDLCTADVAVTDWTDCQRQYRALASQLREILSNQ